MNRAVWLRLPRSTAAGRRTRSSAAVAEDYVERFGEVEELAEKLTAESNGTDSTS